MHESGCLIIDDVEAALATMTDLGRRIVGGSAEGIRDAVLRFAGRRGWYVLSHQSYVDWATEIIVKAGNPWLVLDPIFPLGRIRDFAQCVRLTRKYDNNETVVSREYVIAGRSGTLDASTISDSTGVVDDVAASGLTLLRVARHVSQAGGTVRHVVVAASARGARDVLRRAAASARWSEFLPGDWVRSIHLRDGCPHLAFSGRPTGQTPVLAGNGEPVEVRVLSSDVAGNLWQVFGLDPAVADAVKSARRDIVRSFDAALGRPSCVRDVSLLGAFAPAVVRPGQVVSAEVPLESLAD